MNLKEAYKKYLIELSTHLFGDASVNEIIKNIKNSHRKKRFISLYLAQDKEIFFHYYERRESLGLEKVFSQLISALLAETEKNPVKKVMVKELQVNHGMVDIPCSKEEISEVNKDLNLFLFYVWKLQSKINKRKRDNHS